MIQRLDVDLAADVPVRIEPGRKAWVLVRYQGHVLGDTDLNGSELVSERELRSLLMRKFAAELFWVSRSIVTDVPRPEGKEAFDVSIVVETGGHPARRIDACLVALDALDPRPVEVMMVGHGSQGGDGGEALQLAERNVSIGAARGHIVVFISPRCEPEAGFVKAVSRPFSLSRLGAVVPIFTPRELETPAQVAFDRRFLSRRRFERMLWSGVSDPFFDPTWVHPGIAEGIAYRRLALEEIGGFHATGAGTVRRAEYEALSQIVSAGWAIQSEPDAEIRHLHPRTRAEARHWLAGFLSDRTDLRRTLADEGRSTRSTPVTRVLRRVVGRDVEIQRRLTAAGASARAVLSSSLRGSR